MKRQFARYAPLAVLLVVMLVIAGCSGGYGPTLPSPDAEAEPPPPPPPPPSPVGDFCVNVEGADGQPVAGAWVYIGGAADYGEVERFETNAEGRVCFDDLEARQYGMTTAAEGWATDHRIVNVPAEGGSVTVRLTSPVEVSPTDCPVVTMNVGELDDEAGTAVVSGTVGNADSQSIVVFHNGEPTVVSLSRMSAAEQGLFAANFSQMFFLTPGVNTFQVLAGNAACTVRHPVPPYELNWTPPEGSDFVFRVTLTWDAATDADLHTWAPDLDEHSSYHNRTISGGQLDHDDIAGFGPENFTATEIQEGRWRIAINSYSIRQIERYNVNVRVVTGGLAANTLSRTFGPHTFTTSNSEGYPVEPPSWWRPVDIIVAADGTVSVAAPDGTALPASVSAAAAPAK